MSDLAAQDDLEPLHPLEPARVALLTIANKIRYNPPLVTRTAQADSWGSGL